MAESPRIQRGHVFVYRAFDVADEIDLAACESILSHGRGEARLKIEKKNRHSLLVRDPPLRVTLGESELELPGHGTLRVETLATLFEYGALSVFFKIPIPPGSPWSWLVGLAEIITRGDSAPRGIDATARAHSRDLGQRLAGAFKNPKEWEAFEDYSVFFLQEVEGIRTGSELLEAADLPALILAEPRLKLAEVSRDEVLAARCQYAAEDLVVIDWNAAVVLEPSGSLEICDVLEIALSQLLEVRYYDDLIDRRLSDLYDTAELRRSRPWYSRSSRLAHEANTRYLELAELMARVNNSIKTVGDFYLAVVYRSAMQQFRVFEWEVSISQKMQSLARVSGLLHEETNVGRSHLLEAVIVFLILFEIVYSLVGRN